MNRQSARLTLFAAGWLVIGLVLSLEVYFNMRAGMHASTVDFGDLAIPQFGRAAMWGLLAPFILRLRTKLPLSRGHWIGGIAFHLAMSFILMAIFYVGRFIGYAIWFEPIDEFWRAIFTGFYGRNIIDMVFYWGVIGVGYSTEIYQRYRNEELKAAQLESRLIETELKALRQQLHPHFLFNTLNTIAVLVREKKNDEAVNLITRLSSLLRLTLDTARNHEVPLRQEIDFLSHYVDIQKARFSDRLDVTFDIDPAALEARIPYLLLQPLVENAILHGIAPKTGPGRVAVSARVEQGRLRLEVTDDGDGIEASGARTKEGVGLTNTRERIAKIYGPSGHLALRSERGRGVSVQVIIPCRT